VCTKEDFTTIAAPCSQLVLANITQTVKEAATGCVFRAAELPSGCSCMMERVKSFSE